MDIGKKIKELRVEKGLTQQQLAKELGIARPTLAHYEANEREMPYVLLIKIAKYFDVTTDYLFGLED